MTIQRLEDLKAWTEARKLGLLIYQVVQQLPQEEKYGVKQHMLENARNTPANLAEGFGRFHYQESIQFYRIARGCLEEQRNDVYICLDRNYLKNEDAANIFPQIELVKKLINGLVNSANKVKIMKHASTNNQ